MKNFPLVLPHRNMFAGRKNNFNLKKIPYEELFYRKRENPYPLNFAQKLQTLKNKKYFQNLLNNRTSTNVGPTNVGRYKHETYKRRTVQTSDQYKRQTSTNVGLVQTSDWYKRLTSTNVGRVHL